jgi:hypothetical protein
LLYLNLYSLIGSIYLLMLIAAKHKRADIGRLRFHEVDAICNIIRWPDLSIILSFIPFYYLTCLTRNRNWQGYKRTSYSLSGLSLPQYPSATFHRILKGASK